MRLLSLATAYGSTPRERHGSRPRPAHSATRSSFSTAWRAARDELETPDLTSRSFRETRGNAHRGQVGDVLDIALDGQKRSINGDPHFQRARNRL